MFAGYLLFGRAGAAAGAARERVICACRAGRRFGWCELAPRTELAWPPRRARPALEVYPVDTTVPGHTGNLFPGVASAFARHGFQVIVRRARPSGDATAAQLGPAGLMRPADRRACGWRWPRLGGRPLFLGLMAPIVPVLARLVQAAAPYR